jgi:hypothetical protein
MGETRPPAEDSQNTVALWARMRGKMSGLAFYIVFWFLILVVYQVFSISFTRQWYPRIRSELVVLSSCRVTFFFEMGCPRPLHQLVHIAIYKRREIFSFGPPLGHITEFSHQRMTW